MTSIGRYLRSVGIFYEYLETSLQQRNQRCNNRYAVTASFVASIARPLNCRSESRDGRSNLHHISRAIQYRLFLLFATISFFSHSVFSPERGFSLAVKPRLRVWHASLSSVRMRCGWSYRAALTNTCPQSISCDGPRCVSSVTVGTGEVSLRTIPGSAYTAEQQRQARSLRSPFDYNLLTAHCCGCSARYVRVDAMRATAILTT